MFTDSYEYKVCASGRINIIGEHVDYCGGKVFPAALSLKNAVYIKANNSDNITIRWATLKDVVTLDINELGSYKDIKHVNYIAGSLYEWQKTGHKVVGADMFFDCRVPFGSGLSSSAAIEVSTIAAMATLCNEPLDKPNIALCAQLAERTYAGVNCGIMDQYASACGIKGHAMLLYCAKLMCEQVPIDLKEYSLVIANCNKPHDLVQSKYNERRAETEQALKLLQKELKVNALAEITPEVFCDLGGRLLSGKLYDRAKHVVDECARVEQAAAAMKTGDMITLGKLLNLSHQSLRDLYEVTGKELDALQESALLSPYCIGSRMTGAGFGGCTVSLVKTEGKRSFTDLLIENYEKKIGYAPSVYSADIDDGITVEKM